MNTPDPKNMWTAVTGPDMPGANVESIAPTPLNYQSPVQRESFYFRSSRRAAMVLACAFYINALLIPIYRLYRLEHRGNSVSDLPGWVREALKFALIGLICQVVAAFTTVLDARSSDTDRTSTRGSSPQAARLFHLAFRSAIVFAWCFYVTAAAGVAGRCLHLMRYDLDAIPGNLIEHWVPDALIVAVVGLTCHLAASFMKIMEEKYRGAEPR